MEPARSPEKAVLRLLERLLERAVQDVEEGQLTLTKPRDVLDAAKLLILLEKSASGEKKEKSIGPAIIRRLEKELGERHDGE